METRLRIIKKAEELFWRYGIRSITMDAIAAELGISKKTIYQHFTDKDALVMAVTEDQILFSQTCCKKDAVNAVNAIDEIFKVIEFVEIMFKNMKPAVMYDLEKYHPDAFKKFLEHKNKFLYEMVKLNIQRGIKEELYRSEINVELMVRFRLETMLIAFNTEIFPPSKFNLMQLQCEIVEYFLFSMATLKGHKLILKYKDQRLNK